MVPSKCLSVPDYTAIIIALIMQVHTFQLLEVALHAQSTDVDETSATPFLTAACMKKSRAAT